MGLRCNLVTLKVLTYWILTLSYYANPNSFHLPIMNVFRVNRLRWKPLKSNRQANIESKCTFVWRACFQEPFFSWGHNHYSAWHLKSTFYPEFSRNSFFVVPGSAPLSEKDWKCLSSSQKPNIGRRSNCRSGKGRWESLLNRGYMTMTEITFSFQGSPRSILSHIPSKCNWGCQCVLCV